MVLVRGIVREVVPGDGRNSVCVLACYGKMSVKSEIIKICLLIYVWFKLELLTIFFIIVSSNVSEFDSSRVAAGGANHGHDDTLELETTRATFV